MLALVPFLAVLATASDALAGDHHPVFVAHESHAAAHEARAPEHEARAAEHVARATAGLIVAAGEVAEASGNPEAESTEADDSGPPDIVVVQVGPHPVPLHMPASAADHRVERHVAFDLGGAYGALAKVDLDACKAQGLTGGYGRVVLAFAPDGSAAGTSIDLPEGSSPAARTCVEQAFGAVHVSAFDGAPMNVRRAFFVKA
jgi:hypothetical protein